jgi:hypothetical protein
MNPIHKGHLHMMEQSKAYLETELGFHVVAGYLSPSSDLYVKPKMIRFQQKGSPLGASFAEASHRIRLTQKAVSDSSWLDCSTWEANQSKFKDFDEVLYALDTFLRESTVFLSENDKVFYVCGRDHFEKCGLRRGIHCRDDGQTRSVVVVSRSSAGDTNSTGELLLVPHTPCEHVVVIPPTTPVSPPPSSGLSRVSSTRVRGILNRVSISSSSSSDSSSSGVVSSEEACQLELELEALREMLPSPVYEDVMGLNRDGVSLYRMP